jgi:hypothetical protein
MDVPTWVESLTEAQRSRSWGRPGCRGPGHILIPGLGYSDYGQNRGLWPAVGQAWSGHPEEVLGIQGMEGT